MKKAVIYVKHLNGSPISLESVIERCQEFANRNELEVVDIYSERISDSKAKRRTLERLLKDSGQHNFECVVVARLSNFTTNLEEFIGIYKELKKNDVEVISTIYENPERAIAEGLGLL